MFVDQEEVDRGVPDLTMVRALGGEGDHATVGIDRITRSLASWVGVIGGTFHVSNTSYDESAFRGGLTVNGDVALKDRWIWQPLT